MLSRKTVYFGVLATLLSLLFVINGSLPGQDATETRPLKNGPTQPASTTRQTAGAMDEGMVPGEAGMGGMGMGSGMGGIYGGMGMSPPPMTEAEIDEILTSTGPREPHNVWLAKIQRADATMNDMARAWAAAYRDAETDEGRAEAKTALEELSKKHFDVRQVGRDLEVSRLEERLRQIRAAIAKRNESKDLIVRVRVSALLGEIEWDDWSIPRRDGGSGTADYGSSRGPAGMMSGGMGGMDDMLGTPDDSTPTTPRLR